jgi:ABC-2 type transport system ATP-binding protein
MTAPIIVEVNDVSKRFTVNRHKSVKERLVDSATERRHRSDFWALRDINLQIEAGTTVGLVGHNGSGKSTLLKAIGGIIEPSSGSVRRRGRMAALLELGAGFHPDLTGRENVYLNAAILGLSQREIDRYFDAIVDFSGIEEFIDTQVKFFSSGMYVRLAFAVAVHVDPDLLLVDEVLAVGDAPFQEKCVAKIADFQREGRTIVVVSHSAPQIDSLCDRVVVLDHGEMQFDGDTGPGLRVLQSLYEAQREADAAAAGIAAPQAELERVAIDAEADADGVIPSGSDLRVSFDYRVPGDGAEPMIAALSLETTEGIQLFGLTSKLLGATVPDTRGAHSLDFVLEQPRLGRGTYVIRGSLHSQDGSLIHMRLPVTQFEIGSPRPGEGFIQIGSTMSARSGQPG